MSQRLYPGKGQSKNEIERTVFNIIIMCTCKVFMYMSMKVENHIKKCFKCAKILREGPNCPF